MMREEKIMDVNKRIIPIDLNMEMQKSFIAYAMSVIVDRALPDVRDGLKPVQRRILFTMNELGNTPDKPHKKCARIVGDVMGKYHPHGDSSIYEALVRMGQDFSTRYLLVDPHGNFGSVDGDGAAAMRYTEARMDKIAMEMLRDLDKDTVDFYPNYDETLMQPVTLPSRFPNLLVNGSGGIAVAMATNIPPHNLGEVIDAAVAVIDNPEIDIEGIMEYIKGPDFPTGGLIVGMNGVREAYRTGKGKIRCRAKCEIEQEKDHEVIVVSEIPFQVNKEILVKNIRELARDKKIEGISECYDHSDRSGMRIEIILKKGANANVVLKRLYKHTQLQTTFGAIMIALVDGEPKLLTIKDFLTNYLKYQVEVIERRTRFDLEKAKKRAHILEGLVKALSVIDDVIKTIKASENANTAREALMNNFGFSEMQAQAILDMRLQRLTNLEVEKLEEEYNALLEKIAYYEKLLQNRDMVMALIKDDLIDIKQRYGDERRTDFDFDDDDIDIEELIQEEEMVVTLTNQGYIKRLPSDTYRTQKRGGKGITGLSTKEEDFVKDIFVTSTHNNILFFTTKGKVFVKKCYMISEAGRTAKGTAIVNMLNLDSGERISSMLPVDGINLEENLVMITKKGIVKKTAVQEYVNIRQNGIIAVALREDDELIAVIRTTGKDDIIIGTKLGMSIRFNETDVRSMGRVSIGVKGINLRKDDEVVDADKVSVGDEILVISENGYGKRTVESDYKQQNRGGIGIKAMSITEKTGNLCGLKVVNGSEDIMLISDANVIIRLNTADVSLYGRSAQGVRVMRVDEDTKVVSIAVVPHHEEDNLDKVE